MMFSKEELEVIEACLLLVLDGDLLDADTEKDALAVLHEIRLHLDRDAPGVADAVGQEIIVEYELGDGRRGSVRLPPAGGDGR